MPDAVVYSIEIEEEKERKRLREESKPLLYRKIMLGVGAFTLLLFLFSSRVVTVFLPKPPGPPPVLSPIEEIIPKESETLHVESVTRQRQLDEARRQEQAAQPETYTNTKFSYFLQIPADWNAQETPAKDVVRFVPPTLTKGIEMRVSSDSAALSFAQDWILQEVGFEQSIGGERNKKTSEKPVGGASAAHIEVSAGGSPVGSIVYIVKDPYSYILTTKELQSDTLDTLQLMMSSLSFP
ncbi:MAG TPA: hypothetical protein VJ179_01150 [Patescibacteria group bacterium]|nr:hypothetical protein [Patescibacteria group bacterium]